MRIFSAFLVLLTTAILFLLPVSDAVHDFRTDERSDSFDVSTGAGITSANVTLPAPLFDNDVAYANAVSDNTTDTPAVDSYTPNSQILTISGLQQSSSREITVTYDVYSLTGGNAIDGLLARWDLIWLICLIAFPVVALAAIFVGRA